MKDRYIQICYLIVLSICFQFIPISTLLADEAPVRFKRLSVDDGLSYNTVLALTQDHNNKIWVGTTEGTGMTVSALRPFINLWSIPPVWEITTSILFILTERERCGQGQWSDFPGIIL